MAPGGLPPVGTRRPPPMAPGGLPPVLQVASLPCSKWPPVLPLDVKCDFFMGCDEVPSFVEPTSTCTYGNDDKVKELEKRISKLEDELKDLKWLINKTRMAMQSLPETFSFLNILDENGGGGCDGDSQEGTSVHLD